jgi:hypothetical protein
MKNYRLLAYQSIRNAAQRKNQFLVYKLMSRGKLNVTNNGHIKCWSSRQLCLVPEAARVKRIITKHVTWCAVRW